MVGRPWGQVWGASQASSCWMRSRISSGGQALAGAHGGVAGERCGDAQARVDRRVFAREQVQELDEGARGVVAS